MRNRFILALVLAIPMVVFYLGYIFGSLGPLEPTGFIQYDNVSYVGYGKQYTDADHFQLQYSNPFNESKEYEPIYFQTQFLFFGLLLKAGIPPGWIMIPFSLICSIICFWLLVSIYDHLIPKQKNRSLVLALMAWGGGLLSLAGIIAHFFLDSRASLVNDMFLIDPEYGWWGLNLGRSLFFSCEAYYHALFLGCIYALLKKKWATSTLLLFLTCASHPFTGIELAGIICAWGVVEVFYNRKQIPAWYIIASLLILSFHIYYYLVYLEKFPDHQSVSEQYALNWKLRYYRLIPAYLMVGLLAVVAIYRTTVKKFIEKRENRIFLAWFLVAFFLVNHELFMKARQPVHFSRGYVWTSLILLGLPALVDMVERLKKRSSITLTIFVAIFVFDNLSWIAANVVSKAENPDPTYITPEQKLVLETINKNSSNNTLIISRDNTMAYMSVVYTSAYPWYSHPYTTPFAKNKLDRQNDFFDSGKPDTSWNGREIIFILQKKDSLAFNEIESSGFPLIHQSSRYFVFKKQADQLLTETPGIN